MIVVAYKNHNTVIGTLFENIVPWCLFQIVAFEYLDTMGHEDVNNSLKKLSKKCRSDKFEASDNLTFKSIKPLQHW